MDPDSPKNDANPAGYGSTTLTVTPARGTEYLSFL